MPSASAASGPFSAGTHDRLGATLPRRLGDRQRPVDRPRRAVQRQLADQGHPRQRLPLELAGGAQQRRGDRQVHPRPRLAQAGRGEVDDDPPQRELEAAVDQRRPHPLPRLPHGRVGEADDREAGQAAVDVDLDPDRAGGDAVEGEGSGRGEHGKDATERSPTCYAAVRKSLWVTSCAPECVAAATLASAAMTIARQRTGRPAPRSWSPAGSPPPAGRSSSATPAPATASSTSSPATAAPSSSSRSRPAARAPPSAPSARSSPSTAASSGRSAASPPPGWPSAATSLPTPRSASTPSASPSTAPAGWSTSSTSARAF